MLLIFLCDNDNCTRLVPEDTHDLIATPLYNGITLPHLSPDLIVKEREKISTTPVLTSLELRVKQLSTHFGYDLYHDLKAIGMGLKIW